MSNFMSIPDAIKELAKHGITVSKQSIHARIKRKVVFFGVDRKRGVDLILRGFRG